MGTPLTGMYTIVNLAPHQHQECGPPDRGPADFQGDQPLNQGDPPRGPALKSSWGRVSGGVSPRARSASHLRGVDTDTRVVQGICRPY